MYQCSIPGCLKTSKRRMCSMHRGRLHRDGTPGEASSRRLHELVKVCPEKLTALCKTCGPVTIYWRTTQHWAGWACRKGRQERQKRSRLKRHYGITLEQYYDMLEAQDRHCAICPYVPEEDELLPVDHDHACCPGAITCGECLRGLLCSLCNMGLGSFRDNAQFLRKAASYVEQAY